MSDVPQNGLFCLLPTKRPPWKEFILTMGTQGLALCAVVWVGVIFPEVLSLPVHDYHFVRLVDTPPPINHDPAPVRVIETRLPEVEPRVEALRVPPEIRRTQPRPDELPTAPKVEMAATKPEPLPAGKVIIPRQLVKTEVFSTGSSAIPTIAAAPQNVQTGGFGDPNGVPARETNGKPVNIAQLGSYDLPTGPGYGNGTGGAKGARGVVASAGFGDGVAIGDGSGRSNVTRGTVRQSGFGDAEPVTASQTKQAKPAEAPARLQPAEVLAKPTPIYTDEGRKLKIEGEVLLEVVFEASGKLRVVRVIRGLGHGLDEAAIRAAEQIKFKPAQRDGQAADSTAVLHIVFQLA